MKEYLIGTEVYHRPTSYHPSEDSIVRSEARRLRSKLKEYYDSVGKDTWEGGLEAVKRKGTLVWFGNASGPIPPFSVL